MIAPEAVKEQIENSKVNTDISTSSLMQRALDLYIVKGYWKDYIIRLRELYSDRYFYMQDCLNNILRDKVTFNSPGGGFNFYLKINPKIPVTCDRLFQKCRREKVLITPGVLFYKNYDDGLPFFRIGYSQTDKEKIKNGIEILNRILGG
jgi:DNA-binding transcriptional MocR family regulator